MSIAKGKGTVSHFKLHWSVFHKSPMTRKSLELFTSVPSSQNDKIWHKYNLPLSMQLEGARKRIKDPSCDAKTSYTMTYDL